MTAYKPDLAFIHDDGFDQFAHSAANELIQHLHHGGISQGLVVDLGCGGGVTAAVLHRSGFDIQGIDLSPAHIEMARQRVPAGEFIQGSFLDHAFDTSVAVTAIGEVVNYAFDQRSGSDTLKAFFQRVYAALEPGGFLLFDNAGPDRLAGLDYREANFSGENWDIQVKSRITEDSRQLERHIVHFTREGELYRRGEETHYLNLHSHDAMSTWLEEAGFEVERLSAYGETALPTGLVGFLARKQS